MPDIVFRTKAVRFADGPLTGDVITVPAWQQTIEFTFPPAISLSFRIRPAPPFIDELWIATLETPRNWRLDRLFCHVCGERCCADRVLCVLGCQVCDVCCWAVTVWRMSQAEAA